MVLVARGSPRPTTMYPLSQTDLSVCLVARTHAESTISGLRHEWVARQASDWGHGLPGERHPARRSGNQQMKRRERTRESYEILDPCRVDNIGPSSRVGSKASE
ncbi:hypothetical protein J6590_067648 [Homalodisca vitripennis]|nr:hypothetical protein J6590_067648 [Homalodisca vitripennis]